MHHAKATASYYQYFRRGRFKKVLYAQAASAIANNGRKTSGERERAQLMIANISGKVSHGVAAMMVSSGRIFVGVNARNNMRGLAEEERETERG